MTRVRDMKLIRTAAASAALAAACAACTASPGSEQAAPPRSTVDLSANIRLVAYDSCEDLLGKLREKAAEQVGPYGFGMGGFPEAYARSDVQPAQADTAMAEGKSSDFSSTNVHEAGVDEPDLVKTDGKRVVTVSKGVLRVIDAATRQVTGTLNLVDDEQDAYMPANLLLSGDRALVLTQDSQVSGGTYLADYIAPTSPRYVLVDLSGEPKVIGTIKTSGTHVDARMVGSTVRLVTRNMPNITFPQAKGDVPESERKKVNQGVVRQAPIEAWLPKIQITDASGAERSASVPCERVSHPQDYTGTSMLTMHTIDLAQGVTAAGTDPSSLVADGETVYSNGTGFYVASNPRWWWPGPIMFRGGAESSASASPVPPEETEVHRFDISRPGAPRYVASAKVPGRLLNQYSLSEHEGHLRVATTLSNGGPQPTQPPEDASSSGVYVFKTDTMHKIGEVTGLGKGERIYSVRFMGPTGYVVTFKQVDPLYTLDLRDPAAPKVTGELKITGFSAYLHPAGEGRLIGLGQEASEKGRTLGTQLSLFDVRDPANPTRLSQLFQKDSGSEAEWDPHAFLYWPKTGLTVVPLNSYNAKGVNKSGALVLSVTDSAVTKLGMISHPKVEQKDYTYEPGIQRSLVIGDSLWTLSEVGFKINDLATLTEQAFVKLG
ncbi:beta-propeller domain-containing protein [Nonomuraea sp. NPDC050310]|uniref:beta-propeller domain-containing protein n=1 Tax=Nonomuraea sp. NPDC050310 TaxID=3154935 RepID=UPI003400111E